ncbi:hypothetical protein N7448_004090 [Penicillium atrosanguineum]|uniref:Uncharacterized protein n=1 Tax=Penicillium atrosanguineum TaxID=1132637 RepID=A0A9W9L858_9EURO|nr:uncharacterized protein N7443_003054 [Penicillium atrosanguineum]KAJ5117145.1 hypothetical protein N7526_011254 [Penicillium atrosanguineum]KAJ5140682.1 hypothetical protein N7448_004090 [Penicillium atrosanguineum]KAJ5310593.1 hypothetical protein N7443_003054 [Penicillium atrosanguineum]KAJ5316115.1 hypothetical protein N7476_006422 [Penicillium atrosanguineum]
MSAIHATHTPEFDAGPYLGQDVAQRRDTPKHQPLDNGLQWGSDPSFCYHGFSCPIGTWTEERLVRNLMRNMATMCDSVNIDFNYDLEIPNNTEYQNIAEPVQLNGFDFSRHRQYRSETPGSISSASTSGSEKRKSMTPPSSNETHASPPSKKRKCVQKPGQKLCHCRSEKKRREIISQGYQDISNIVPALGKHNYTRKYVLEEAAKFIKSLTEGNEQLRRQLDAMKDQEERDMKDLFLGNKLKM